MALFIPILLFAGAATISLLAGGCGGSPPKPPAAPEAPPEPPPLNEGYPLLLSRLEAKAWPGRPRALALNPLLQGTEADFRLAEFFPQPRQVERARELLRGLAAHDRDPGSVSLYDIYFEAKHPDRILGPDFQASPQDRLRTLAAGEARELLASLATYVGSLPAGAPESRLTPSLAFFLNGTEPAAFRQYLKIGYADFLAKDEKAQNDIFGQALAGGFPSLATLNSMLALWTPDEAGRFLRECLARDPRAALEIFEKARLPIAGKARAKIFDESDYFPKLPQNFPYAQRQKAIDEFLPAPVKTLKRGKVVLKKYLWPGDTEVFSLEGPKPGPTTLVFSPHFHEKNPRKVFHWLKDLPLQSGRVLFLPEANRAMGLLGGDTNRMNSLFNKAFEGDDPDHLVVRRVEWLMGLCDGMIGLHDWARHEPFFISDAIVDDSGIARLNLGPLPSPWIPAEVRKIRGYSSGMTLDPPRDPATMEQRVAQTFPQGLQVPWQIAEQAAARLRKLSGRTFERSATPLSRRDSYRIDNATAYMNYFLKKPAMTFEATAEADHGQLSAQAVYALLLAFGHGIEGKFEAKLQATNPVVEPDLYVGLPPGPETP